MKGRFKPAAVTTLGLVIEQITLHADNGGWRPGTGAVAAELAGAADAARWPRRGRGWGDIQDGRVSEIRVRWFIA